MTIKSVLADAFFVLVSFACVYYFYKEGKKTKKNFNWSFKRVFLVLLLGIISPPLVCILIYSIIGVGDLIIKDWLTTSTASCFAFFVGMIYEKSILKDVIDKNKSN